MSNELENNIIPIELNGACPKEDRREETAGFHNPPEGIILPPSQEAELNPLQDVASNQPASNSQNEGAAPQETAPNLLIMPNSQDINLYLEVVFNYCKGWIPIRAFGEGEAHLKNFIHNRWIKVDREAFTNCLPMADLAAINNTAFYMIPGTVEKPGQARAAHIINMQTVLIDIDTGNIAAKLAHLRHYLKAPTLVVESGGITAEGQNKLHAYWQLTEAYEGDDLKKIAKVRELIALKAGGDLHFKSLHQPIRVPGSVYLKHGAKRLVRIIEHNDLEYDLAELLEFSEDMPLLAGEEARYVNWGGKTNGDGRSATDVKNGFDIKNVLDFNGLYRPPIESVMTTKVYEGGINGVTRFESLSRIIGYWLRQTHEGHCSFEHAWQEIQDYNEACVRPSWPIERLQTETKALWNKHVKENGEAKEWKEEKENRYNITAYSARSAFETPTTIPDDLISPRVLTPGGMWLIAGPPKIGKSDFLLNLLTHAAAGIDFLFFKFPRPLRVFYAQAEIEKPYLDERYRNVIGCNREKLEQGFDNLYLTPRFKFPFDEKGLEAMITQIQQTFSDPEKPVDIVAVDPFRNIYQSGLSGGDVNEDLMAFFQRRLELLLREINPQAGLMIAHHTNKITGKMLHEDPMAAVSGGGAILSYPTSLSVLGRSCEDEGSPLILWSELRNGPALGHRLLSKRGGLWCEMNQVNMRLVREQWGDKNDREQVRKRIRILEFIFNEAAEGQVYTAASLADKLSQKYKLGGAHSIRKYITTYEIKGFIRRFNNKAAVKYGLVRARTAIGYLCVEGMGRPESHDEETGEVIQGIPFLPTHYRHHSDTILPLNKDEVNAWVYDCSGDGEN